MFNKLLNFIKFHKKGLIFSLIISIIFIIPTFSSGIYNGYDMTFHLNRLVGIGDAIRDGQILPKIYPYTNNGYGYASPLFYAEVFLYPFALIHMLGVPLVLSYKLMLIFYTFLGTFLMYYVLSKIFKNNIKACMIGTFVYTFAPYRFIDIYLRSSLGEFIGLTFLPLILYSFYKIFYLKKDSYIFLAISLSFILFAHNISFILYCIVYVIFYLIFIIYHRRNKELIIKATITSLKAAILGFLLTLWFTIPMLEQLASQTFNLNLVDDLYNLSDTYLNIKDIVSPIMTMNNEFISVQEINAYSIGLIFLFLPIDALIKRDANKNVKLLSALTIITIVIALGIIPLASFLPLNFIQFSSRWTILIIFFGIIPITYYLKDRSKYLNIIFAIYMIINLSFVTYNIMNMPHRLMDNNALAEDIFDISKVSSYRDNNDIQISGAEYLPPTEKNDYLNDTTFIKKVSNGLYEDVIYEYDRYFSEISFTYNSDDKTLLMLPLTYYKGYSVNAYVNNTNIPLDVINVDTYHKVGFYTIDGNVTYTIKYTGTTIQHVTLFISVISWISLIFLARKKVHKNEL